MKESRSFRPAETAKLIRADLKAAFPAVTFSVKTRQYAGGSSIDIKWTDGPTTARVKEITGSYEGKGFDGMTDSGYYIDAWVLDGKIIGTRSTGTEGSRGSVPAWGLDQPHPDAELVSFGGSMIFETRTISPDLANRCIAQLVEYYGIDSPPVAVPSQYSGDGYALSPNVYNEALRPDMAFASHHYCWGAQIRAAAEDATKFQREVSV